MDRSLLAALMRASVAAAIALAALAAAAVPAAAECMSPPTPRSMGAYVGDAFLASVRSVSDRPTTQIPDAAPFSWEVVLDVTRVYRGSVPSVVVVDGWRAGCSSFRGSELAAGDTLIISADRLRLPTLGGNVLAWRQNAAGWQFDYQVILPPNGGNRGVFPPAAERATTHAEILALVAAPRLPSTDTASTPRRDTVPPVALIVLAAAALGVSFDRRRRSRTR